MKLILNCKNHTIEKIDEIPLSLGELKLLSLLINNNYVSYDEIYEAHGYTKSVVYNMMHSIRNKFPYLDIQYIQKNKSSGLRLINEFKIGG